MANKVLLGDIEIDVVTSEKPEYTNLITEKPVERGQDIADHARNLPLRFSFTGVVTGDRDSDAKAKYEKLIEYRNNRDLLDFAGRNLLSNMMIESLSPEFTKTNAKGFSFSCTLKQVRIAVAEMVNFVAPDIRSQVKSTDDRGRRQTDDQDTDQEGRRSLLYSGINAIDDYFAKMP